MLLVETTVALLKERIVDGLKVVGSIISTVAVICSSGSPGQVMMFPSGSIPDPVSMMSNMLGV